MLRVHDVLNHLEARYPKTFAEHWDSIGLIAGRWDWQVQRILVSVDIDSDVVAEAIERQVDLVISHHPLALPRQRGPEFQYKQRIAQRAISHGIALANAHTNADHAKPGVSDALASALGLTGVRPLVKHPLNPEFGTGRVGELANPLSLEQFVALVESSIPRARARSAGDLSKEIKTVALVGGSGDSFLAEAARFDVYVTSDLRHHPVAEHLESGGCPVVDINHQAAEAMWLPQLAKELEVLSVEVIQSQCDTAHWN